MTGVCTIVAEAMITGRFASTDDQIRDEPRKSVNRLDVRKVGLDGNVLLMWRGFTRGYLRRQVPSFLLMDEPDCVTGPSMRVPRVGPLLPYCSHDELAGFASALPDARHGRGAGR